MDYDRPHAKTATDWGLIALVLTVISGIGIVAGAVGILGAASIGRGRYEVPAVVDGYEEHGFPEKTNDWLRVTFPETKSGSANAAFRVSRTFRQFKAGEKIRILYRRELAPNGHMLEEFLVHDARVIWTGPVLTTGISLCGFLPCFTWWRRVRARSLKPAEELTPAIKSRWVAALKAAVVYLVVWAGIALTFLLYANFVPNNGGFTQSTANFVARCLGATFGVGLVALVAWQLAIGIFRPNSKKKTSFSELTSR
ncbi:MAG: hypothetical protein Q7S40_03600 [Opitutaceae bacterium]|nr:hypothetical protein [Opitutaceae bacterium]